MMDGWEQFGGYKAGDRSEGMTTRWTEPGGDAASSLCRFLRISVNGEPLVRGIAM